MNDKDFLIEAITSDIIKFIVEDKKIAIKDAMKLFYNSQTYELLQDFKTGIFTQSSGYVYDLYLNEKNNGHIIQQEV